MNDNHPFTSLHHLQTYLHNNLPSLELSPHNLLLLQSVGAIGFLLGGLRSVNRFQPTNEHPPPGNPRAMAQWSTQQGHLKLLAFGKGGMMMAMGLVGMGGIWIGTKRMASNWFPPVWAEGIAGALAGGLLLRGGRAAGFLLGGVGGLATGLLSLAASWKDENSGTEMENKILGTERLNKNSGIAIEIKNSGIAMVNDTLGS